MPKVQTITPCLWFDTQAEQAVDFYCGIFQNSRVVRVLHYSEAAHETFQYRAGSVMTIEFELDGQRFTALNGGPEFKFNEAISLEVSCETQQEVDYFWEKLTEGGEEGPCGRLKDKFGLSWQIVPSVLGQMLADPDQEKVERVTNAFLQMRKLEIALLERAFFGG
jgi:predicted 3-demethylubiquinone-9 3-methyltransferase (glyoxalase superfamily)